MQRNKLERGILLLVLCLSLAMPVVVSAQGQITHTVQPGENLFRIALYYGTSVDAIIQANGLSSVYIYVGQKLVYSGCDTISAA